jgi:putative NADH-flavin reductase
MQASDVRRLVCLTGAMVGELPPNVSLAMRALAGMFRRRAPRLAADSGEQERIVIESGLDWTIVKPPRLTDGPLTGRVRAGAALRVGLLSKISRNDLAACLLDEVGSAAHVRQRIYVRK